MPWDAELEKLKRDPDIWRVVSSRIQITKQGPEWKGLCPFHVEKSPSFTVYTGEDGVPMYKCFGCNANGNLIQFVERHDRITFAEAKKKVSQEVGWKTGKEYVEQTFAPLKEEKENLKIPLAKLQEAEQALETSREGRDWLAGRGVSLETAKKFHLGFVRSAMAVNPHHPWVNDGWIIFPSIEGDQIVSLKYRSVRGKKTEDGTPGFLRKKGMATALFGADKIEPFEDCYVTEGEPDALVMAQAGFIAVSLPSAGFNLTPEMRDRVMASQRVFLAGDMDGPGQEAMTKLWAELRDRTYLLKWPEGMKDANQTYLDYCSGDVEKFREEVERLKHSALEQPISHIFDLRETLRTGKYIPPRENPARLRFPWPQIDSWGVALPGDVIVISATETGQGKTSFLMDILLENAIKYNKTVINMGGELPPQQYAVRAAAYLLSKRKDEITDEDLSRAADVLGDARFYNGYKPGADWKEAIELIEWAIRRLGGDICALDHLHFYTRSDRDEIKAQAEAMRRIKDLAIKYNKIMIVLGQPRKPLANHRGREVVTQDLKGSEALGSDASMVFLLHRDRKSNGDDENMPIFDPVTKVKLDKSRESEPRATKLYFDGAKCTFKLLESNYGEYDE